MVLGYHIIFSMYGFWLPNDPRGSWSEFVGAWELLRFGRATKVDVRHSVAGARHDGRLRRDAKTAMKWPPVTLTGQQALAAVRGFGLASKEGNYAVHACSILPEHVHMVAGRHDRPLGQIVGHFKGRATQRLGADGLWPDPARPVWAGRSWKVFLFTPEDMRRAIAYVEANPEKEGKPRQRWSFVRPYVY